MQVEDIQSKEKPEPAFNSQGIIRLYINGQLAALDLLKGNAHKLIHRFAMTLRRQIH